jgi:hypothetical protein
MRTILATAAMLVAGLVRPHATNADEVVHWLEADNKTIRPGESVEFTWWCQFSPGVGGATTWLGNPATVFCFQNTGGQVDVYASAITGTLSDNYLNPELLEWPELAGQIKGNTIFMISPQNLVQGNPKPTKANPLWLFKFTWTPDTFLHDTVEFVLQVSPVSGIKVEVPSLNYYCPPWCVQTAFPNIQPASIYVTVTDQHCPADCDRSDMLDIDDFICFQTFFALGDPQADCDGDGVLLIDDFICFQTAFVLGC